MRTALSLTMTAVILLLVPPATGVTVEPTQGAAVTVIVTSRRADTTAFPITARVGDEFKITLDSNATTGYKWQLERSPDIKIVQFVLNAYNEPSQPIPGRGGSETWTFRAAGKGKTKISLNYVRPWEKGVKPIRTQRFEIEVR